MKYWLNIYSDTFIRRKNDFCLLYNAANGNKKLFKVTPSITPYLDELENVDNLYTVEISKTDIDNYSELKHFVKEIISTQFGQMVVQDINIPKPISLYPILNLQKDIERLRKEKDRSIGESLTSYLTQVSIFIGGDKHPYGDEYYKQVLYPINTDKRIPLDVVEKFICNLAGTGVRTLNVVGNIFTHPDFEKLLNLFRRIKRVVNIYVHYSDFVKNRDKESALNEAGFKLKLVCDSNESIKKTVHDYIFYVSSEEEYDKVNVIITSLNLENYDIIPVWTGENEKFFQDNVYLSQEEIMSINISKREVFALQALNTNFFGKLILLPNGNVYSNINDKPLGRAEDSIYEMLYKEMDKINNWRVTRNNLQPCSDCVYSLLCPSASNYEYVIGKNNLCNIKF